jgi:hypothetical protein
MEELGKGLDAEEIKEIDLPEKIKKLENKLDELL